MDIKPRLSFEEFYSRSAIHDFREFYDLPENILWSDVLGKKWLTEATTIAGANTPKYRYELYLIWYSKTYSKLGQALK